MSAHTVDISVVIPTTGRPELHRAVASAQAQTATPREIVVVADGEQAAARARDCLGPLINQVIFAVSPGGGGGAARQFGTETSSGRWVAYLDDDDEWLPEKLRAQLKLADELGGDRSPALILAHVEFVREGSAPPHAVYPTRDVPRDPRKLANWLVARRKPRYGETMLQSSTIFIDRSSALETGWNQELRKHQDWDFLIRASAVVDGLSLVPGGPLARVFQGSTGSVSKTPDPAQSRQFLRHCKSLSGRSRADFVLIHVIAPAIVRSELRLALNGLRLLHGVPHAAALLVAARSIIRSRWSIDEPGLS